MKLPREGCFVLGAVVLSMAATACNTTPTSPSSSGVSMDQVNSAIKSAMIWPAASKSAGDNADEGSLWRIQPGLGTVMIEYRMRFNNAYFAANANPSNWPMAAYQIDEMREIQEVGETTRPGRATSLKAFEHTWLDALAADATAKNLNNFNQDYKNAISGVNGCNSCHDAAAANASASAILGSSNYSFVHIQMPSTSSYENVDWSATMPATTSATPMPH